MTKTLTCIECPIGCELKVEMDAEGKISVTGNACPRGKMYAIDESTCPKRIVTSTVRAENGVMVPVKTDVPVKKSEIFNVMEKINRIVCKLPVKIGDVVYEKISDDANLIVTGNVN